jgi:fucose permease
MNQGRRTWPLFAGAAAGIGIYGIAFAILGTVLGLPQMEARLHLTTALKGNVFLLLYVGVFLSNALTGPFIEALGSKLVLAFSAVMVSVSLLWFSGLTSFSAAASAAMLLGFGGGTLNVAVNALVSDLYPTRRGSMLNLLGVFFGVGALSIPFAAATLLSHLTISHLFMLAATLPAAVAVYYVLLSFPCQQIKRGLPLLDAARVLRLPGVMQIGILLFFENADEAVIAAWTSIYVISLGCKPHTATVILGCYWASMMVGRVIASQLIKRISKMKIILGATAGAIAGCTLLFVSREPITLAFAVVVTGLSFAPIFKTTLSIAGDRHPQATAPIFGVVFAMSLLGAMGAPWIVGQISQHYSIRLGPLVPILGSVCVGIMALLIARSQRLDFGPKDAVKSITLTESSAA